MLRRKPKPRNEAYATFAQTHACPWCWACGRSERERPRWWYAPFIVERAHIVSRPRKEHIKAVCLLCSACHKASHGEHISKWELPRLTTGMLVWLKANFDQENFDRDFLQTCSVRILPQPEPLPDIYRAEYAKRHDRAFMESIRDELHCRAELIRSGADPLPEQLPGESDTQYLTRLAALRGKGARK